MEVIEGSILISSTANFEDIFVEVKEWFDCIITDCIDTYFNNSCRISDIIDFLKENDVKDVGIPQLLFIGRFVHNLT